MSYFMVCAEGMAQSEMVSVIGEFAVVIRLSNEYGSVAIDPSYIIRLFKAVPGLLGHVRP
jgi:hypothetical protein